MKRLFTLFATIMAVLAVACGNDEVDKPTPKPEPGPTPGEQVEAPFEVEISATTRGSVTFSVTPADPTIDYLCMVYEKAVVEEFTKEQFLVETIFSDLALEASDKGETLDEYMAKIVDCGDLVDEKFVGLDIATEYYLIVFGVEKSGAGYKNSTDVVKAEFATQDVEMSDCTFDVTPRVVYNNVTFTVKPSNKDILWYLCTVTKEMYDYYVIENKMGEGSFYRWYFQQEINSYLQSGYTSEQVVMALIHQGDLEMGAKGLNANTEYYYIIAGMTMDEEGIIINTDISSGTYTTGDAEPSEMYFDIEVFEVGQMSVSYRIKPSNDNDLYCALVQPWDGVSTADEVMHQIVDQWGPGWMSMMANCKGTIDNTAKPKSLPAADTDYYIIAFGYSGGITTEAYMETFHTLPGGTIDEVAFTMTASNITPYGFTMNITSSDPTIYYVAGACQKENYDEAKFIAEENEVFDYYYTESKAFNPSYTVAETLDQYYYNGNSSLGLSGLQPDTEVMAYVYALDIKTGHVAKSFIFDAIARTATLGSVNPSIEVVGYYSGDDEAGSIFGSASLTEGRAITVVKYNDLDGASALYTTMIDGDYTDIVNCSEAELWNLTNGYWKSCKISQPYTFYLSDWNYERTALAYATDAADKVGRVARCLTMPTAENKGNIEELRTLKQQLDNQKSTSAVLPMSLVVPASVKATVTEM